MHVNVPLAVGIALYAVVCYIAIMALVGHGNRRQVRRGFNLTLTPRTHVPAPRHPDEALIDALEARRDDPSFHRRMLERIRPQ